MLYTNAFYYLCPLRGRFILYRSHARGAVSLVPVHFRILSIIFRLAFATAEVSMVER